MKEKNAKQGRLQQVLLSVILAIVVWACVIYVNPPEIQTTVYNLPVRLSGEVQLKEKSLTVVDKSEISGLSVVISGKRNDLLNLSGDMYVDVDVSSVTAAGTYNLSGNVTLPSTKITIVKVNFESVPITVDNIAEKEINIEIDRTGSSDYFVKTAADTKSVTITGAESELEEVSYGLVTADISNINSDVTLENGYILMNSDGSPITKNETIEASSTKIAVSYELYERVTLPIELRLSDEMEENYILDKTKSSVSSSQTDVGIREGYSVPSAVYALIDEAGNVLECELQETDGMYIPDAAKIVTVKPTLEKKAAGNIKVSVSCKNLSGNLSAAAEDITVAANGAESELTADNITASVDLSNYTEAGEYDVAVTVKSDILTISGTYTTKVTIKEG